MRMYVHAAGAGKTIQVVDRVAGADAFNGWVGPDATIAVDVQSPDGQTGNIDINARMTAANPWFAIQADYDVRADETIDVGDI